MSEQETMRKRLRNEAIRQALAVTAFTPDALSLEDRTITVQTADGELRQVASNDRIQPPEEVDES